MRLWLAVCVATLVLSPGAVRAVSEAAVDAGSVVQEKVDRDERGVSMDESLRREIASRAEAEKRVERIRNLPPERVQDWIDGKLSEADLERVTSGSHAQQEQGPEGSVALPRDRLTRLALVSLGVMVLAFFYGRQRRRERMGAPK